MTSYNFSRLLPVLAIAFFLSICTSCSQNTSDKTINESPYEQFLTEAHARAQFNGNALIFEKGEIVYQGAFGIRNMESSDPLNINSVFRLASVSKQFTAMGIMILKERGKLNYDQDIRELIPELPYEGITVRHLLNHVSGLPDYTRLMAKEWKPELKFDDPKRAVSGNEDAIQMLAEKKPEIHFKPLEKWEYSNTGYMLLASIINRVSGVPFSQFLQENVFKPAGMTNTSVYTYMVEEDPALPNRTFGFRTSFEKDKMQSTDFHFLNNVQGDGGIYSTLADLLHWDRMLYKDKLVSAETLEEAFTAAIMPDGKNTNYGFGWQVETSPEGKKTVSHSGGWAGFATYIQRDIEDDRCVIVLSNNSNNYFWGVVEGLMNILNNREYALPRMSLGEEIGKVMLNEGVDKAVQRYKEITTTRDENYIIHEQELNQLGYQLIWIDKTAEAVAVLRLNMEEYPKSANTYDSYGDALLAHGDSLNALVEFKKAFSMNSTFTETDKKIKELESKVKSN